MKTHDNVKELKENVTNNSVSLVPALLIIMRQKIKGEDDIPPLLSAPSIDPEPDDCMPTFDPCRVKSLIPAISPNVESKRKAAQLSNTRATKRHKRVVNLSSDDDERELNSADDTKMDFEANATISNKLKKKETTNKRKNNKVTKTTQNKNTQAKKRKNQDEVQKNKVKAKKVKSESIDVSKKKEEEEETKKAEKEEIKEAEKQNNETEKEKEETKNEENKEIVEKEERKYVEEEQQHENDEDNIDDDEEQSMRISMEIGENHLDTEKRLPERKTSKESRKGKEKVLEADKEQPTYVGNETMNPLSITIHSAFEYVFHYFSFFVSLIM